MHAMLAAGSECPMEGVGATWDWLGIAWHGYSVTHLDAHSHVLWNQKLYGGRDGASVTARRGARWGSIETAGSGIAGRGVLLDLAAFRGEAVAPGEAVSVEELRRCAATESIDLRSGDLLLVRFGREAAHSGSKSASMPGLNVDCLPWLYESEIALLGTDFAADSVPSQNVHCRVPIHAVGIVAMGLWILDNLDLSALSEACIDRGRWGFLFTVAPLKITGGTGSPVNPVALL
jgi:kynurenine formamidase